jgi:hypothetical protein
VRGTLTIFLLAILRVADHIVKIYMPEVHDNGIKNNLIVCINTRSEKFYQIYTGRCEEEGNGHKSRLVPYSNT